MAPTIRDGRPREQALQSRNIMTNTVSGITNGEIKLVSASRTDAGVHALGQVAVFATGSKLPADIIKRP